MLYNEVGKKTTCFTNLVQYSKQKKLNVTFRIVVVTVEQRERKDNKQTLIERK